MAETLDSLVAIIRERDVPPDYRLCALAIHEDAASDRTQEVWAKPISRLQFDDETEECLLVVREPRFQSFGTMPDNDTLSPSALLAAFQREKPRGHFGVCVCEEWSQSETSVRIDYPVIGTGENHEARRLFAVIRDELRNTKS